MKIFCDLNAAGVTVLMVTHSEEDARMGSRVISMLDGGIVN